jgi:hypothetical protein
MSFISMSVPLQRPECVVSQKQLGLSLLGPPSVSLIDRTLSITEDRCPNVIVCQKQLGPSLLGPPTVSLVCLDQQVSGPLDIAEGVHKTQERNSPKDYLRLRAVRGTDVLIYEDGGIFKSFEVSQRLSLHDLENKHPSSSPFYFIWNKNVKILPNKLHGVLCFLCGKVWVVVKAIGRQALVVSMLPQGLAGEAKTVQLHETTGYYIQQIAGPCLGARHVDYRPLSSDGYIKMSTSGPDVIHLPTEMSWWPFNKVPVVDWSHSSMYKTDKVKKEVGDLMVPVVYVKDDEEKRFMIPTVNSFLVPTGEIIQETMHYKICNFAEIDESTLWNMLAIDSFDKAGLKNMLYDRAIAIVCRVVPLFPKLSLKIKLVTNEEFHVLQLKKNHIALTCNGMEYIFGQEAKPGLDIGITISEWHRSTLKEETIMTYNFFESCVCVYGLGFGSRARSKCLGLNAYRDARTSTRPHPTPFVADEDIALHQYFNKQLQNKPLLQPMLEKSINKMAHDIKRFAESLNPGFGYLCTELCTKTIITSGTRPRKYGKRKSVLAFVNTSHVDSCDILTKDQMEELEKKISNDSYLRLIKLKGFGLPTTCGYQFVMKEMYNHSYQANQFFSLDGLGIAIPISDGLRHYFYASSFAHRTCLCLKQLGSQISITNEKDDFTILAWGASGGKTTAAAATKKRKSCD